MVLTYLSIDDGPRSLGADEVHLWSAPLEGSCDEKLLTAEEHARAERFKMERVRRQFMVARSQLRTILGWYLNLEPTAVPIISEPSGKPLLDSALGQCLHFNVSHSEGLAVFAITRRGRVGVDVEQWRDMPNAEMLVERFFTKREHNLFLAIPETERLKAFFHAWTRKEAALKAVGRGVQSLDQCDVTFGPGEPEIVLRMGDDREAAKKWLLKSWHPAENYMAAVAVEMERDTSHG